jgi:hypothetical protein
LDEGQSKSNTDHEHTENRERDGAAEKKVAQNEGNGADHGRGHLTEPTDQVPIGNSGFQRRTKDKDV